MGESSTGVKSTVIRTSVNIFEASKRDELLGMSTTSMDFDVVSVEGEAQLQVYMQVQQVPNDTDPLMWWKQLQSCGTCTD